MLIIDIWGTRLHFISSVNYLRRTYLDGEREVFIQTLLVLHSTQVHAANLTDQRSVDNAHTSPANIC